MTQTILGVFETFERLSVGYPHIGKMWTVIVEDWHTYSHVNIVSMQLV